MFYIVIWTFFVAVEVSTARSFCTFFLFLCCLCSTPTVFYIRRNILSKSKAHENVTIAQLTVTDLKSVPVLGKTANLV